MMGAFAGDAHRSVHPFGQRRQPEPSVLDRLGPRREFGDRGLMRGQLLGCHRQPGGGLVMLAAHRSLGLKDRFPFGSAAYQSSAARRSRASRRSAWMAAARWAASGLPAQRFELTPELGGQIGEPGQVRRHRVEFAQSFFLALAMLEHTGGFLDERPPILRPRLQDLLELPLPNNHMHSRPMPESLSNSCTSIKRQLLPLISYSLAPSRNILRVIDTSVYSIGSALSELSMLTVTSARPSGARDEVPAKMTSSILPPRSVFAPCSPSPTPGHRPH